MDTRPLTEPIDPVAARAFERSHRQPVNVGRIVIFVFFGVLAAFIFGIFGFITVVSLGDGLPMNPGMILFAAIAVALVVFLIVRLRKYRVRPIDRFRLSQFAAANAMTYVNLISSPPLPGMIFRIGERRMSSEVVRGQRPRFVEFANYRYQQGYGKDSTTRRWGYIAVKLDVPLPHIVLDAVGNNSAISSNLPLAFDKSQKLSLEGDFNRHFTLYCPAGYERDALYLFTPDVMSQFIRGAAALDVEIIDDWMFLYTRQQISTTDVATWSWLFDTVDALMMKLDQWGRWRDDRLTAEQTTQ